MKHQQGEVKVALIATIGALVFLLLVALVVWGQYTGAYRYGNKTEQQLTSIRENNQNIYAQGTQKVLEIAQVPGMFKDDYAAVIKADIEGRYGKDGSRATVQFLKEHDIHLDPSMYTKIQQTIEAFRDEFKNNQTRMIDVKRSYTTALGNDYFMGQGWWLNMAGYPKVDLAQFKPIITDATDEVYKRGKESGPLKLR